MDRFKETDDINFKLVDPIEIKDINDLFTEIIYILTDPQLQDVIDNLRNNKDINTIHMPELFREIKRTFEFLNGETTFNSVKYHSISHMVVGNKRLKGEKSMLFISVVFKTDKGLYHLVISPTGQHLETDYDSQTVCP